MIQQIKNIFEEKEFDINKDTLNDQNYYFCARYSESKFDFFVVLTIDVKNLNVEKLNNWSALLIDKLVNENSIPGIDKNLSMIILMETTLDDKELNKAINKIEEDPYYFKKYVLTYTDEQEEKLTSLTHGKSVITEVENYVGNKEKFTDFKRESGNALKLESNLYSLISKIFIKLSFLTVPIKKEKLINLSDKIRNQIKGKDSSYLDLSLKINSDTPEVSEILHGIGVE